MGEGRVHGDGGTEDGTGRLQWVALRDLHHVTGHRNISVTVQNVRIFRGTVHTRYSLHEIEQDFCVANP